jgi:ABC-2 type transport system ATP-binding protein
VFYVFQESEEHMSKDVTQIPTTSGQTAATPLAAIEVGDLCKSFGTFKAVDHLSLSIKQGEIFGLLGPNGSGKTTTINMISGLSVPTSGEVRVMGFDVRHNARQIHQILGSVPQETALYEELSAWTNMDFHADLFGIPRKEKKVRITRLLELVQLLDRKDSRVGTFSGGMKRRLALARALLHDPQLIYLDEPTLGVDVQARRAIWDYILSLRDQGKTVLITTNYLEEAQVLCERVAIIDHGKLIEVDTPEHLKQTYGGSVIEVETEQPVEDTAALRALAGVNDVTQEGTHLKITVQGTSNIVAQIITLLSQGGEIKDIDIREPNLDEIFLLLTGTELRD